MNRKSNKSYSSRARHKVTINYKTVVSDGEGGFVTTWHSRPNVWASIWPISAKQVYEFDSIDVHATHMVGIRGNLTFQSNTKYVNDTWTITWVGILGANVQIDYQIDGGSWTSISASELNTGTYDWLIPIAAIGRNIIVRVMDTLDPLSYSLTNPYNIVAEGSVDGLPKEYDEITWTAKGVTRTFEVLTVENLQEIDVEAIITCKERRD